MANSEYEYTRRFEQPDNLLANTWIVIRIDGHSFHKLTSKYEFEKPNDQRALRLMNQAAHAVMNDIPDICVGYGHSDEYSFVLHPSCQLYERRESKLVSTVVSKFTAYYIFAWRTAFSDKTLTPPLPSFDGRAVVYPSTQNLRDYLSWRQADCHINNLYNTTFWALVQKGGVNRSKAEKQLSGTVAAEKHEILFTRFNINYNNEPEIYRKGTIIFHDYWVSSPLTGTRKSSQLSRAHSERPIGQPKSTQQLSRSKTDGKDMGCLPIRLSSSLQPVAEQGRVRFGPTDGSASGNPYSNRNNSVSGSSNDYANGYGSGGDASGLTSSKPKIKSRIATAHVDIIGKEFWNHRPWVLKVGSERKKVLRDLFHWSADHPEIPELDPDNAF